MSSPVAALCERLGALPLLEPRHRELAARARTIELPEGEDQAAGRATLASLARFGVLSAAVDARGQPEARALCVARETLAYRSPFADGLLAVQGLGCAPLALAGSEGLRRRYLEPAAGGGVIAAFAVTEPEAGSDLRAIRTRARRIAGGYQLDGEKLFISNAPWMDFAVVFAALEGSGDPPQLSAFLVERGTPGLAIGEPMALLSAHPLGGLRLDGCRIPEDRCLGGDQGLALVLQTLERFRPSVGAAAIGMAQRALDVAVEFLGRRIQFGRKLQEFQGLRFELADAATALEAARLMVYRAAWAADQGQSDAAVLSSMAKLQATETAQRVVDRALQFLGARGLIDGSVTERLYREIRALRIYEGTSEIQKLIIARRLLG